MQETSYEHSSGDGLTKPRASSAAIQQCRQNPQLFQGGGTSYPLGFRKEVGSLPPARTRH